MVADKGKKSKVAPEEESDHIDGELVLSIEKLQEVQDDLEKVLYLLYLCLETSIFYVLYMCTVYYICIISQWQLIWLYNMVFFFCGFCYLLF